ncbi:MAG: HPF/RaiA family ribosome-associated protein, partial [Bacteroidota bacterium]
KVNEFVNEKLGKPAHLVMKAETADVCLSLSKSDTRDNKVCEIKLKMPGNELFARKKSYTFEEATVAAVDALQEQIR